MTQHAKVIHVKTWEEFKRLAISSCPSFIAYTVQNAPLSRPPLGLRLVFATENFQYVFLDFAHGNAFRQTRVPVYTNDNGDPYFREEDLRKFIHSELNRKDIRTFSFEVIGY